MKRDLKDSRNVSKSGADIYLYIDYSFSECKDLSSIVCLGREKSNREHWDDNTFAHWIINTFERIVDSIVCALDLKDNRIIVVICGDEQYIMTDLTDDIGRLGKCITLNKFAFGGGDICPGKNIFSRDYNPYKEIYYSAMNNRKVNPGRKSVGIVITQSNKPADKKEDALNYVKLCSQNGIEIITIGIKNKNVDYKIPVNKNEINMLSNNKDLSIVCDYDSMLEYLKKIVKMISKPEFSEKRELEQSIKEFHKYQEKYDKYSDELMEFENQYENLPQIKSHKNNIDDLYKKRCELADKNMVEHFGVGWILFFGVLGLLLFFREPLVKWISESLSDGSDVFDLKILFAIGIPIFGIVVYFIKDNYKHYIFLSLFITIIIAKVISFIFMGLGNAIAYFNVHFSEHRYAIGIGILIIEILLVAKKIIRNMHVQERVMEMRQLNSKIDAELDAIGEVILFEYKKIYDRYTDIGSERKKIQDIKIRLLEQFKRHYKYL